MGSNDPQSGYTCDIMTNSTFICEDWTFLHFHNISIYHCDKLFYLNWPKIRLKRYGIKPIIEVKSIHAVKILKRSVENEKKIDANLNEEGK